MDARQLKFAVATKASDVVRSPLNIIDEPLFVDCTTVPAP